MAEPLSSSKDELIQHIKRLGTYLALKMSNLFSISFQKLDPRSVGAIAGLAVAIVFTYRLMRSPAAPPRRQPKRQTPLTSSSSISTQSNATLMPSGVCLPSEDLRAQHVVDEFFQPVKPTLGQIVRQKLSEGRKVTCRLLGVILEESSPEELQAKQATVKSSVLDVLLEITKFCDLYLTKFCDLYLMERVIDDESEVLFCSTENGHTSFVRQLEPDWHIDTSPEILSQLARFIKYQLHISPVRSERTAANVFSAPSLEHFFGCARLLSRCVRFFRMMEKIYLFEICEIGFNIPTFFELEKLHASINVCNLDSPRICNAMQS
ncbi:hypothetical protein V6N13_092891 [Hibiscus sabdariffa]|uniref:Peroxisome biogenesis protein 22 n=1 Tax=Hibiscus sabdariffa TaxID=183260 RepID=A0ABR2B5Z7_9ROSI